MGVLGVAALEEWCRRQVEDYPGVRITDMSSSWRDGLAFCALIHKHTNNLIHWDSLDPADWRGNLELAFRTSEDMLGIPALLETEDLLDSEFPDQFSVMTYLAQFYHLFSGSKPRGRDSGLSSFKNSSTEEEVVRREVRTRPVSWHQPRAQPHLERDNPFRHENSEDADDEMGEQRLRRGGLTGGQQEVVQRRRRPASLHGVSSLYRQHRRSVKRKHVSIGHSDLPRPYQPRDLGLASIKRRRSEDIVTENNINNETAMRLRERRDEMIESVVKVRRVTSQGK